MVHPGNPIKQLLNPTLNTYSFHCINIDITVGLFAKSEYKLLNTHCTANIWLNNP